MSTFSARKPILLMAVLIASTAVVAAQSGRRGKAKSTAPPTPSVSGPAEPETKPKPSSKLDLLVGVDNPSSFERVPYYMADTVLYTCVRRLAEAKEVMPTPAPRRMTRSDAMKAAKAETGRHVIWLQVGNERAGYGAEVSAHSDQLYVTFVIFEPGSGKIKASGRAQHGTAKVGDVGVSGPTSTRRSVAGSDYAIKQSARQAADKILAAFGIRMDGWPRHSWIATRQSVR